MLSELLSTEDAARITGLSIWAIRKAIRDGELGASKLRGRLRIHPDDLGAWIDDCRVKPDLGSLEARGHEPPRPPAPTPPSGSARAAVRARRRAA
jgi:excisionase family DNA binding protein